MGAAIWRRGHLDYQQNMPEKQSSQQPTTFLRDKSSKTRTAPPIYGEQSMGTSSECFSTAIPGALQVTSPDNFPIAYHLPSFTGRIQLLFIKITSAVQIGIEQPAPDLVPGNHEVTSKYLSPRSWLVPLTSLKGTAACDGNRA